MTAPLFDVPQVPAATFDQVLQALRAYRYPVSTERDLQHAVERVLQQHFVRYEREFVFDRDSRPDFYLPDFRAALELKVDGSTMEVTRQLYRYAGDERVDELVLMTSRYTHARVPHEMRGKTVRVITLWEGAL
jgi:hypothetical protein